MSSPSIRYPQPELVSSPAEAAGGGATDSHITHIARSVTPPSLHHEDAIVGQTPSSLPQLLFPEDHPAAWPRPRAAASAFSRSPVLVDELSIRQSSSLASPSSENITALSPLATDIPFPLVTRRKTTRAAPYCDMDAVDPQPVLEGLLSSSSIKDSIWVTVAAAADEETAKKGEDKEEGLVEVNVVYQVSPHAAPIRRAPDLVLSAAAATGNAERARGLSDHVAKAQGGQRLLRVGSWKHEDTFERS